MPMSHVTFPEHLRGRIRGPQVYHVEEYLGLVNVDLEKEYSQPYFQGFQSKEDYYQPGV